MSTKERIDLLVEIFKKASDAALAADPGPDADGGTCNMDCPAFACPGMREKDIQMAAEFADVRVTDFHRFASRWFWLCVPLYGQGNRRTTMAEAASNVLDEFACGRHWFESCMYYRMD